MFQPYSTDGKECIRSVSRLDLNKRLIDSAEKAGAKLHFDKQITRFSPRSGELFFTDDSKCSPLTVVATDGAYSPIRRSIMNAPFFDYTQKYHAHGYKELCIPPIEGTTKHRLEVNALHIWPRGTYMMIALPNTDGSFTCTLFMPLKGEPSLESLDTDEKVMAFFHEKFADAVPLMPTLLHDFKNNPSASLMTISCFPWSVDGRLALLGDACHALVPFFGQGMNCAFEDVFVMDKCIDELAASTPGQQVPWEKIYKKYEVLRKPNADAILELALDNYIEMRDKVADKVFQFRSKVAEKVGKAFPNQFKTRYELVSFSNIPYTDCIKRGLVNDSIIDELVKNITDFDPEKVDLEHAKTLVDKYFPSQH
jgi:kynurenine 3-monooxygenase